MQIHQSEEAVLNGKKVYKIQIKNDNGLIVSILNYGGIISSVLCPDKNGNTHEVVLGYDSFQEYLDNNPPHFGAIIGRFANRIGNASFTLDGKTYNLYKNDGENHLHGGKIGFDKKVWEFEIEEKANSISVKLNYLSPDGEEGYPGRLDCCVTYTLNNNNEISIDYSAKSSAATPLNFTNHSYFNLSGEDDILKHKIQIFADKILKNNEKHLPDGSFLSVENSAFDLRQESKIKYKIKELTNGYDHNYVLNNQNKLVLAAVVSDEKSGRKLKTFTTQPGLQFYTSNYLDGCIGRGGESLKKHGALCLEAQHYPDSPNIEHFPNCILRPGEKYEHSTVYCFEW